MKNSKLITKLLIASLLVSSSGLMQASWLDSFKNWLSKDDSPQTIENFRRIIAFGVASVCIYHSVKGAYLTYKSDSARPKCQANVELLRSMGELERPEDSKIVLRPTPTDLQNIENQAIQHLRMASGFMIASFASSAILQSLYYKSRHLVWEKKYTEWLLKN